MEHINAKNSLLVALLESRFITSRPSIRIAASDTKRKNTCEFNILCDFF